jgi:hypothetical protein
MKTSIDIPENDLVEVLRNTGASTKREAILIAVRKFNRERKLHEISSRLYGSMPDFMTQEDLARMRDDESAKSDAH